MRPRGVQEPFKVVSRRAVMTTVHDGVAYRVTVECSREHGLAAYSLLRKIARQQGWDESRVRSCDVTVAKGVRQK